MMVMMTRLADEEMNSFVRLSGCLLFPSDSLMVMFGRVQKAIFCCPGSSHFFLFRFLDREINGWRGGWMARSKLDVQTIQSISCDFPSVAVVVRGRKRVRREKLESRRDCLCGEEEAKGKKVERRKGNMNRK